MKTKEELQADLDAAQAALNAYGDAHDVSKYMVGHIDDVAIANRVLAVFKKADIKIVQETYNSLDDAQWLGSLMRGGYWDDASYAGLFGALLSNAPTNTLTSMGFRCVARPFTATEIISPETFLRRFEDGKE